MSAEERRPLLGDGNNEQQSTYISRLRTKKFTTLEKVLIPLATVFFVSLGVLAGVYIKHINNENSNPPSIIPNPPGDDSGAVSVNIALGISIVRSSVLMNIYIASMFDT